MKYTLTMDEEQAQKLSEACELYARLKAGQWGELLELCLEWKDPLYRKKYDEAMEHLLKARAIVYPNLHGIGHSYGVGKLMDAELVWELYKVLEHRISWTRHPEGGIGVNFDTPMCVSGHDLAVCTAETK